MISEKVSGVRRVSDVSIEMRSHIIGLAGPRHWHDTRESWLAKAARKAGISYRCARSLFYCEQIDPRFSIVERVRAASSREQKAETNARAELAAIRDQLTAVARHMAVVDPEYFGESIALLEQAARPFGSEAPFAVPEDRALD